MTWTVTAGVSPIVTADQVITVVHFDNGLGKTFDLPVSYDGTLIGLQAATRQKLAQLNASGTKDFVAAGTVLDLSAPVVNPPPPPNPALVAWAAAMNHLIWVGRMRQLGVSAFSAGDMAAAQAAVNALPYDPSFEGSV